MAFTPCPVGKGCSVLAYRLFGDCVCSSRDLISFLLGLMSIFFWGVAEVPQIIANWRQGHSEGVSLLFIITWTVGDVFNLVGCLMSPVTLPTQFYTAVLYTATTLVLVGQHIWYTNIRPYKEDDELQAPLLPDELEPDASVSKPITVPGTPTGSAQTTPVASVQTAPARTSSLPAANHPSSSHHHTTVGSWRRLDLSSSHGNSPHIYAASALTGVVTLGLRTGRERSQSSNPSTSRRLLQESEYTARNTFANYILTTTETEFSNKTIGLILGWGMTFIYLMGRLPQIILNIQRGSVEGLSFYMFAFAICGNATYMASILVRSTDWEMIHPNLPWLVDAACCLLMDIFILAQFFYYRSKCKRVETLS